MTVTLVRQLDSYNYGYVRNSCENNCTKMNTADKIGMVYERSYYFCVKENSYFFILKEADPRNRIYDYIVSCRLFLLNLIAVFSAIIFALDIGVRAETSHQT